MKEKELEIIEAVKNMPSVNGYDYKGWSEARVVIGKVMGYETEVTGHGFYKHTVLKGHDTYEKVEKIILGMERHGIIKFNKSRNCFKVLV